MTTMTSTAGPVKAKAGLRWSVGASVAATHRILVAAEHVSHRDRALLHVVYDLGLSAAAFARAVGADSKNVQVRLRRLVARVLSPRFQYVLKERETWPAERRAVADAVVLQKQTLRQAALSLGMSIHQVRQELVRVEALFERDGGRDSCQL